ncbi:MAG: hypothetical protein FWF28_06820 [Micrococcales bacterium]|nr:hypothetical protein [Micrococcales bacterium]
MSDEELNDDQAPESPASGPEWWDDPSLPWRHKPTKTDLVCFTWIGVVAVYAIAMWPLRPVLLGFAPQLFGAMGHYTGMIMTGALAATGDHWWPLVWAIGCLGFVKFTWVYWWAGKLWGRNLIEVWSGKSERARRRNDRAERFARKYETLALIVALLPIPLPTGVIFVALGAAGTSLRKFLITVIATSVVFTGGYIGIGYLIGKPAVQLVDTYSTWLLWASVAILVVMIVWWWWKRRKQSADSSEYTP